MAKPIPFPTGLKRKPEETTSIPESPQGTELKENNLSATETVKGNPIEKPLETDTPPVSDLNSALPAVSDPKEEMPSDLNEENCVTIEGKKIEIKPTKTKYFRNKTASVYGYLKQIPLTEFFTYGKGAFPNDTRDADQILYDFLVAVFDDRDFVRDHYDEITADEIDRIIKIFGRINHIDEKEEAARKNREAQAKR